MIIIIIQVIQVVSRVLQIIILADIVLSYFMDPFNPIRSFLDKIVQPMLKPIQRVVPPIGMVDLSPLILLVIIYFLTSLIISILIRL